MQKRVIELREGPVEKERQSSQLIENNDEIQYLALLKKVLEQGTKREDRTGTGTLSLFGEQMKFDLTRGFPLLTTKKIVLKSVVYELLWFLKGETNARWLQERGVHIWDAWANDKGELGRVYGAQWRDWQKPNGEHVDQIANLIEGLKSDPYSRRHLVVAFNPGELDQMALPPCHAFFQFYVANGELSCQLYQRSADLFLGVPFNIASYSLLTHMIAQVCGLKAKSFVHTLGDVHLYLNHLECAKIQLERWPRPFPKLKMNSQRKDIFDFEYEDFEFLDYNPHPRIKAAISV